MSSGSRRVVIAALIGNMLIAVTKFIAALLTGSAAMLSEFVHSLVDTGNQVLLLYGLNRAQKPPDRRFPFGHGKEVYFWAFVVAILIFGVGAGVSILEGVRHLLHPRALHNVTVNYVVLAFALVFEGVSWIVAFREFRRTKGAFGYFEAVHRGKDPTLFLVLFEDSAAMLGLLVALAGVALSHTTGIAIFDGIASVIIGVILGATAGWLAFETKGLLIGESANRRVVDGIHELVAGMDQVRHVNEVLTMHMGPEYVLLNLSVKFADEATARELEAAIVRIEYAIKEAYPEVKRIFVEAEARRPMIA